MKKSILLPIIALSAVGITCASVFASQGSTSNQGKNDNTKQTAPYTNHSGKQFGFMERNTKLTDTEKQALESMSNEEKQAFFEKKQKEAIAAQALQESVIDKLLAWTALTSEEEQVRQTMIQERATRKAEQATMKANMEKIKAIQEKKKAGTQLTTEEQTLLDSFPKGHAEWASGHPQFHHEEKQTTQTTESNQ